MSQQPTPEVIEAVARKIDPLAWLEYGDRRHRDLTLTQAKAAIAAYIQWADVSREVQMSDQQQHTPDTLRARIDRQRTYLQTILSGHLATNDTEIAVARDHLAALEEIAGEVVAADTLAADLAAILAHPKVTHLNLSVGVVDRYCVSARSGSSAVGTVERATVTGVISALRRQIEGVEG